MDKYQKEHYKKIPQRSIEEFNKKVEEAKKAKEAKTTEKKTDIIQEKTPEVNPK